MEVYVYLYMLYIHHYLVVAYTHPPICLGSPRRNDDSGGIGNRQEFAHTFFLQVG